MSDTPVSGPAEAQNIVVREGDCLVVLNVMLLENMVADVRHST